jgi:hypothetical protein
MLLLQSKREVQQQVPWEKDLREPAKIIDLRFVIYHLFIPNSIYSLYCELFQIFVDTC